MLWSFVVYLMHASKMLCHFLETNYFMIWQGLFIPSTVSLAVPLALMSLTRFLTNENYGLQNETMLTVSHLKFFIHCKQ
jgi:hypothetical protein